MFSALFRLRCPACEAPTECRRGPPYREIDIRLSPLVTAVGIRFDDGKLPINGTTE